MSKGRFLKPEEAPKSQQRRKGKREKENGRRGKGREEKIAMVALLVFIIAHLETVGRCR